MKHCLVISDSFKGTLSSPDICRIARTVDVPGWQIDALPVADGGEETTACFLEACGGQRIDLPVSGPFGGTVDGFYGLLPDGTAVIECAAAAGLHHAAGHMDPEIASTYGVGQLMAAALDRGARRLILGLGGSCTNDAGCGAAAVLGAEPVVKCEGYKTAIAVSTVVIFGTLSMFLYPLMFRMGLLDGLTDTGVAVYTGSTLHEVAHVAGAGNAMDPTDALGIAGTATITKMIRVMMLAPVLVVMGFVLGRRKSSGACREKSKIAVPWFAFGFIGIICLNSLLQYLFGVESVREIPLNGAIEYADTFLLTMAMTALGTETSIDKFRQAGAKPFVLAGLLYVWLVAGGYFVTKYLVGIL